MSLDIYLRSRIVCPHCHESIGEEYGQDVFSQNITHNLGRMAEAAGLYGPVWRPEENGIESAKQLIPILEKGIETMKADKPFFEQYNDSNGWGLYEHFVPWLENLLIACKEYPDAYVRASR